jgi:hypothetical protein
MAPALGLVARLQAGRALSSQALLVSFFLLVACLAYSYTLKMGVVFSSEKSVNSYQTTRHHIPVDSALHNHSVGTSNAAEFLLVTTFCGYIFIPYM